MPLTRVDWQQAPVIGDETEARNANDSQGKKNSAYLRLVYYQRAARAYRQLAVALRSQGLNEAADRYAYRGHLMQREVLWRQAIAPQKQHPVSLIYRLRSFLAFWWSNVLWALAGYGYYPTFSVVAYLVIIEA